MTSTRVTAALGACLLVAALLSPSSAYAQRRAVRVAPRATVILAGGYSRPLYYDPWAPYPFGWYPYGWYPAAGYAQPFFDDGASLRLQVTPRETEVYIDGYYAGSVDNFDGVLQRLRIEKGEHELVLYLDGYRTVRQRIFLQPNATFRVRYTMEQLQPGDVQEPRPETPTRATAPPPGRQRGERPPAPAERSTGGTLAVRVQPEGADILIDGERWEGPEGGERLLVQVDAGTHHIEIRREGYRTFQTDVTVRGGDTTPLNVSLTRQ